MTPQQIQNAMPGQTIWDKNEKGSVKGLHLRVTAKGDKGFFLYYVAKNGRQRRPKIGSTDQINLTEARRIAKDMMARVILGEDPKADWDDVKSESTLSELFDAAWKEHWNTLRYRQSGWAKDVMSFWRNNLEKPFGKMKLSEITPPVIKDWHQGYKLKSPYTGNRSLQVLSRLFVFAEEKGIRSPGSNPCPLVRSHPEKKRGRYATKEELVQIWLELEQLFAEKPQAVVFIILLMLTGARPISVLKARWDQLKTIDTADGVCGILTFDGKMTSDDGQQDQVIIPPLGMKYLTRLDRNSDTITGLKYPPMKVWYKIRKKVGCEDMWIRDFRRTFATTGMSNGVEQDVIGRLLNHRSLETTKGYALLDTSARVKASKTIADHLQSIAPVVSLRSDLSRQGT
jgi:integrase